MNVLGIGIIFTGGCGIESFENALTQGWQMPSEIKLKNKKSFAYQVELEGAVDKTLIKKMRRSDKLSKMAVCAASKALENSGIKNIENKRTGIITATAFGAHVTTFDFLDHILEYGEANVSPTVFSNSVHNAAASYISSVFNIQGPTLTVTQFFFSFHSALQLAGSWLQEGRCDYILVGAIEQYGDILGYVYDTKLTPAPDGKIKPFNFNPTYHVPGEGAVFFLVSNERSNNVFCKIKNIFLGKNSGDSSPVDLNIIDTDGLLTDESVYIHSLSKDVPVAAYSPLFGSTMISSAFNCAAGALMLKNQVLYESPVKDNPRSLNIVNETRKARIELIRCIRYNCSGYKASIIIQKSGG
jgi:3-oxoacyl-[acyl-carrier-protein] synthase II